MQSAQFRQVPACGATPSSWAATCPCTRPPQAIHPPIYPNVHAIDADCEASRLSWRADRERDARAPRRGGASARSSLSLSLSLSLFLVVVAASPAPTAARISERALDVGLPGGGGAERSLVEASVRGRPRTQNKGSMEALASVWPVQAASNRPRLAEIKLGVRRRGGGCGLGRGVHENAHP
eukprot:scaffold2437_cov395-Prasinococcus_capsulatus_cf.AAC.12